MTIDALRTCAEITLCQRLVPDGKSLCIRRPCCCRLTEKKLVCGLAADMIGGQSFVAYLKKNEKDRLVVIYEFWTQAELYLQYKRGPCDNVHSLLTMRKAILLMMQFLNESEVAVALSPPVCERLKHLLPDGDGDDFLRDVQDALSQVRPCSPCKLREEDRILAMQCAPYYPPRKLDIG